jgi:DNA polymerase-3 subunit alpha
MAFATLEDTLGKISVVFFPKVWGQYKATLELDQPALITGKLDLRDDQLNLLASTVSAIKVTTATAATTDFTIDIPRGTDTNILKKIGRLLKKTPGPHTLSVTLSGTGTHKKIIPLPYKVNFTDQTKQAIQKLLSP